MTLVNYFLQQIMTFYIAIYFDRPTVYNTNSFFRDTVLFAIANSLTSLLSGFVVFSVLGFMAFKQKVSVKDVAESGMSYLILFLNLNETYVLKKLCPFILDKN